MKGNTEWDEERREENGKSKKIYRKERDGKDGFAFGKEANE